MSGPIIPKWFAVIVLIGYSLRKVITNPFFVAGLVALAMLFHFLLHKGV